LAQPLSTYVAPRKKPSCRGRILFGLSARLPFFPCRPAAVKYSTPATFHHSPYAATLAEGESFTTVEMKINFLRAVRDAIPTSEAKVVKAGATLGYVECEVKDE